MKRPTSIAGGWREYKDIIEAHPRAGMIDAFEQAFYAGAVVAFGIILEASRIGKTDGAQAIKGIRDELEAFADKTIAALEKEGL